MINFFGIFITDIQAIVIGTIIIIFCIVGIGFIVGQGNK